MAHQSELAGDMGISSERTFGDDADSIEGTGSVGSSTTQAEGTVDTTPDTTPGDRPAAGKQAEEPTEREDMEKANADVAAHHFDPGKSPGHSHG